MTEACTASRQIKEICLRLLANREYSQQELLEKLSAKGFAYEQVRSILAELASEGYQSDQRYAVSYARQRLQKGYGALRIMHELRQRGITHITLAELEDIAKEVAHSWLTLLTETYHKKYGYSLVMTRLEWAKRFRFLLQRGFSVEQIGTLIKQLALKFKD